MWCLILNPIVCLCRRKEGIHGVFRIFHFTDKMFVDGREFFSEELEIQTFDETKVGQLLFSVKQDKDGKRYLIELHSNGRLVAR